MSVRKAVLWSPLFVVDVCLISKNCMHVFTTSAAWCAWSKCANPSLLPLLQGDASAPPPPAPRQGPRQLLSSLLGLADLCPDEWPARGASQAAAQHRDAAASSADDGGLFEGAV
jgi:hypothetical protein